MANNSFQKSIPTLVVMFLFSVLGIYTFYRLLTPQERLPVFSPVDVNPRLVDASLHHVKKNHKISDFELVNQNGATVTQATFDNKIYVADFFFTRCGTICPLMSSHMLLCKMRF